MAITVDELLIKIELSGQKTSQELSKISKEVDNIRASSDKTSKGIGGISANFVKFGAAAFAAVQAAQGLVTMVSGFAKEYMDAQDAITRLNSALQLSGQKDIPQVIEKYKQLGDQIESFGVASTEAVLRLAQMGTAAGQTSEQTEQLIKTAADLSVARDIPLDAAFNALSKTLKGSAGALAAIFPEIANFTDEQLKAGKAVEYLDLQLSGFAQTNLKTFSGQLTVLKSRLGDVAEEFGKIVVNSANASGGIKKATLVASSFAGFLRDNSSAIESFFNGFFEFQESLLSYTTAFVAKILSLFIKMTAIITGSLTVIQKALSVIIPGTTKLGDTMEVFTKDLYGMGEDLQGFFEDVIESGTMFPETAMATAKAVDAVALSTERARAKAAQMKKELLLNNQKDLAEELKKKIIEIENAYSALGKTGVDAINAQAEASQNEFVEIIKKVTATQELSENNKLLVSQAEQLVEQYRLAQIYQLNEQSVGKVLDTYKSLGDQIAQQTMTQREFIDYQLQKELEILEIKRQATEFGSGEAQELLDLTEKRLKLLAEAQKKKIEIKFDEDPLGYITQEIIKFANTIGELYGSVYSETMTFATKVSDSLNRIEMPDLSFEGVAGFAVQLGIAASDIASAGVDFAAGVGNAFLKFSSQMMDYIGTAVNFVIQAPEQLKKIFLELPRLLLNALRELPALIGQITKEFPKILSELMQELPGLLIQIAQKIPDFIFMLLDQIPMVVEKLSEALPEILIILVKNIPKFIGLLLKALINAVLGFIKGLGKGIMDLLSGKKIKLDKIIDTKGIEKKIKDLSGETGKMFSVSNLTDAAQKPLDKIGESLTTAGAKARDYIKEAGRWLDEKLWQPLKGVVERAWAFVGRLWETLKDFVRAAWKFVSDLWEGLKDIVARAWQFVKDLWDGLSDIVSGAWQAIIDFFNGLGMLISSAWQGIVDFFKSLPELIKQAWQFVVDLFNSIGSIISGAFQWVIDKIITPLSEIGKKIAEPIGKAFEGIKDLGGKIWEGLKSGLQSGMSLFTNIGTKIWESLKSGLSGIGDFLKNIFDTLNPANLFAKIFKVDMGGRPGTVETALGIDVPFMSFASGGLVPGQAKVGGDSLINDRILALLSPGEAIIPRSAMEDPSVAALVQSIIEGKVSVPQYAWGVSLPKVGGTLGQIGEGIKQGAKDALETIGDVLASLDPWEKVKKIVFEEMIWKMFEHNKFANGGIVGPGFGTDTVPAMLTPGEFVMNRGAVQANGLGMLSAMNRGQSHQGGDTYNINFEIQVDAKTTIDEGYIRGTLIPKMSEELRRASLDGKFVLSSRGIR